MTDYMTPSEIAAARLPGMPAKTRTVQDLAKRSGWSTVRDANGKLLSRRRQGRGGGMEYHVSLLPESARAALTKRTAVAAKPKAATADTRPYSEIWDSFERLSDNRKAVARQRLELLTLVEDLHHEHGFIKDEAVRQVASLRGVSRTAIYGWFRKVDGVQDSNRLPFLIDRRGGNRAPAQIVPEVWNYIRADWLRLEQPSFTSCYRRLQQAAEGTGWPVPKSRTLERRLHQDIPEAVQVLAREGRKALERMFPAQERDRTEFHALQAVNADGHEWDVWVKDWPGDKPGAKPKRPLMVAIQDLYSNKMLAWRIDKTENMDVVRLAFADVFRKHGIPELAWLDNGRAFASKFISGQQTTRFRNKIKLEEPAGILTALEVKVHWTKPYSGQSKPIERAFRDFCDAIAKHPAFAGAYAGNKPENKPDYPGKKKPVPNPVPYDTFMQIVSEGIKEHNARRGRKTQVCGDTLSFDEAFNKSYEASEIRKATPEQIAMCLLAAESVTLHRQEGSLKLAGNRYWAEALHEYRGERVMVRFDPDDLQAPARVYTHKGIFICAAPCIERTGFSDTKAARTHERQRREFAKLTKKQAALHQQMTTDEIQRLLPEVSDPEPPQTKVVRLVTGGRVGAAALQEQEEAESAEKQAFMDDFHQGLRLVEADDIFEETDL